MKENLYYLFMAGIILGSGPCLSFCAPVLISYTAAFKTTIRKSLIAYAVFSFFKLCAYGLLGIGCAIVTNLINSQMFMRYSYFISLALGSFMILLSLSVLFYKSSKAGRGACASFNKGNVRNIGMFGFLIGLSPCLPLLGILNYIVAISKTPIEAVYLTFVFGLGTVVSPILIFIMLSAKFADIFSQNKHIKSILRIICAVVFALFGIRIFYSAGIIPFW